MYLESFLYLSEDKKSKLENAKGKYIIFYKNIYKNIEWLIYYVYDINILNILKYILSNCNI